MTVSRITGSHGGIVLSGASYADPVTVTATATIAGGSGIGLGAASEWTAFNHGAISSAGAAAVDFTDGGAVTNAAKATIQGYKYGVLIGGTAGSLTNSGDIASPAVETSPGNYDGGWGVALTGGGAVDNAKSGTIDGYFAGVLIQGALGAVENAGSIAGGFRANMANSQAAICLDDGGSVANAASGRIFGYGYGVVVYAAAGSVTNSGKIETYNNAGVDLQDGGSVTNAAGGSMSGFDGGIRISGAAGMVTNSGGISVGFVPGVWLLDGGSVTNAASSAITGYEGVSIGGAAGTVTNDGAIAGYTQGGRGVVLTDGGSVTNEAAGDISGYYGVLIEGPSGTVVTAGTITGEATYFSAVTLAGTVSNRLIVEPGAVFGGASVANSDAANTLELAETNKAETLTGIGFKFVGFQTLLFDAGGSWTASGYFTNVATIAGFTSADTLDLTNIVWSAADSIDLTGGDVLQLRDGADAVLWSAQLESASLGTADYSGEYFKIARDAYDGIDIVVVRAGYPLISAPASQTIAGGVTSPVAGVKVTDRDAGQTVTVTVSDFSGLLSATAAGGAVTGAGTTALTLTGSASQVNAALATLTYAATTLSDTISLISGAAGKTTDRTAIALTIMPVLTSWTGKGAGAWSSAANWSGGKAPDNLVTEATIGQAGAKVAIGKGQSFSVAQLTLDGATARLFLAGALTTPSGLNITSGSVTMDGGSIQGPASLAAGTSVTGYGTIAGNVDNAGLITTAGGALTIAGNVDGTGTLVIDRGATLELGGYDTPNIDFADGATTDETLVLDQPSSLGGAIRGFASGDTIDLKDFAADGWSYQRGALRIYNATASVFLTVVGSFTRSAFVLSSDDHGGTDVTLTAAASSPAAAAARRQLALFVETVAGGGGMLSGFGETSAPHRLEDRPWDMIVAPSPHAAA